MNLDVEKFVVVKEIIYDKRPIPIGTELGIVHGCVYYNGGLLPSSMQQDFLDFIDSERIKGYKHIKPYNPIYNKV